MVCLCHPSTWEAKAGEGILLYRVSFSLARAYIVRACLKIKPNQTKTENPKQSTINKRKARHSRKCICLSP